MAWAFQIQHLCPVPEHFVTVLGPLYIGTGLISVSVLFFILKNKTVDGENTLADGGEGTPCTSTLKAVGQDTPGTSIMQAI